MRQNTCKYIYNAVKFNETLLNTVKHGKIRKEIEENRVGDLGPGIDPDISCDPIIKRYQFPWYESGMFAQTVDEKWEENMTEMMTEFSNMLADDQKKHRTNNLTKSDQEGKKICLELKKDGTAVFQRSDKTGRLVVMPSMYYENLGILGDPEFRKSGIPEC